MAKDVFYRFCHLERETDTGRAFTASWLPESHKGVEIRVGTQLSLKSPHTKEIFPEVWRVMSVSGIRKSPQDVREKERMWMKWRKHTDV